MSGYSCFLTKRKKEGKDGKKEKKERKKIDKKYQCAKKENENVCVREKERETE